LQTIHSANGARVFQGIARHDREFATSTTSVMRLAKLVPSTHLRKIDNDRREIVTPWKQISVKAANTELAVIQGGTGKPLLILHDELGFPGWLAWNEWLADRREQIIPLQPGFGKTSRLDWVMSYRDLAAFYSQVTRELKADPIDVIGFSAGGYIAAEMAAADPKIFSKMVLVAPMGIKPATGQIMDFFELTIRRHLWRRDDARAVRSLRGRALGNGADRLGALYAQSQPAASALRS
jgi:pimeloyl-ACP methyl ester carboxylesterase